MENNTIRTMPENIQAEQSILAIMFLDNRTLPGILEKLSSKDFYKESHQVIFEAATTLFSRDTPFNVILLADYLESTGNIEKAGGISYLTKISTLEYSTAFLDSYVESVSEKALRRLIQLDEIQGLL